MAMDIEIREPTMKDIRAIIGLTEYTSDEITESILSVANFAEEGMRHQHPSNPLIANVIDAFSCSVNAWAHSNGFWDGGPGQTDGEKIALIHSELSEAIEGLRHGNPPDDKIPEFSSAEAEMADAVIRIMDLCKERGWRLGEAIVAKRAFNETRPLKNGKAF